MYIRLTEKCNMTCAHCCFAATRKGADMSHWVFEAAIRLAANMGEYITLGGGEPTVHKEFFTFLDRAIELFENNCIELPPLVITNGKLKTKAWKLLEYIEEERPLHVELSQDEWHDPIDENIVLAFRRHQDRQDRARYSYSSSGMNYNSSAGIRTVKSIVPVGRAADVARGIITSEHHKCACEDLCVDPHGNVWSCGCQTHLLGNVFDDADVFSGYDRELAHEGGGLPVREFARLGLDLAQAA